MRRSDTGLRKGALGEFRGTARAASGICLAVVSFDLRAAVVPALAATAVEPAP
ncbi:MULTISPECIES: hypothetical protein [Streptomyces]|uniref:hypothetical protein n=1 Tax=Streptomyces TaxID=1883 RepID=UPI0016775382|nr:MULTISPECIES: hypothetical protein [Streptomyces]MBD3577529.1 hypothetical protein [Streptomyces sp. KD18]GGT10161.1 hypothetical protein GCM10010286_39710 [Streptomyces toxytricini]